MKAIETQKCPDCMDGIVIVGVCDAWGCDAFEKTCPKCKGSGELKIQVK